VTNDFVLAVGGNVPDPTKYVVQNFGDGLYRVSGTITAGATNSGNNGVFKYATNSSRTFKTSAWQLEAGAFATSYIPTVTSQVTRSADSAVMTGVNFSSWYNQSEGTLFFNASLIGRRASGFETVAMATAGATNASLVGVGFEVYGNKLRGVTRVNGPITADLRYGNPQTFVPYSCAFAYKTNDFAFCASGASVATDVLGGVPVGVDRMTFCKEPPNGSPLNGHIIRIMYYNTRLSNAQLQVLTS
jgi:hypothetical protein